MLFFIVYPPRIGQCVPQFNETFIELRYALRECGESGEGASINADRHSEKLGLNVDRRPQAGGLHCTLVSAHSR